MAANDTQVGGNHYGLQDFQHWDMVVHFKLDYFQGQITKYVMRWREKGGIQDLKKAQHFLEKYIEVATQELASKLELGTPTKEDFKWAVEQINGKLVARYGPKAGGSQKVSGQKVRAVRRKKR